MVKGGARVTQNDVDTDYTAGETVLIKLGDKHRMANPSQTETMEIIEVQTGNYFGEDDIIRIEDDYDRPEKYEKETIDRSKRWGSA